MPKKFSLSDYLNEVQMEVGTNFLPLPVIQIPDEDISLRVPLYEYSFAAEQRFLDFLSMENGNTKGLSSSLQKNDLKQNGSILQQKLDATESRLSNGSNAYDILKLVDFPTPSPLTNNDSPTQQKQSPEQQPRDELSEFEEHGKSVFDMMELKCIDEMAELQRLWDTSNLTNKE